MRSEAGAPERVNPTRELELPKSEYRLPTSVLTVEKVEHLLNQTDVQTPMGIRDRAESQ